MNTEVTNFLKELGYEVFTSNGTTNGYRKTKSSK